LLCALNQDVDGSAPRLGQMKISQFVTVQPPPPSPIEEETFFHRPWWEGLGDGTNCYTKANKTQSIKCFFIDCPCLFCFNFYHISNWFFNDQEFQRVGWVKRSGPINNVCFLLGVLALHPFYIITMVVAARIVANA